jgi:hypothetical protein
VRKAASCAAILTVLLWKQPPRPNMRRSAPSVILSLGFLCIGTPHSCTAQWTKDIECPPGSIYRDLRPDAGRQEFCERLLPGSLRVKDGPFRLWFSEGHPGDEGTYQDGRQVGQWKECNRFGKCSQVVHELTFPYERERSGFHRDVPITFQRGKYVFNFTSCWGTWVTQTGAENLHLNIQGSPYRCNIAYLPQHVIDHGGEGDYYCRVPFSVGRRAFDSLDLLHELSKLGLPQFCRPIDRKGEAFTLSGKSGEVATTVDIESTVTGHDAAGHEIVRFRLNQYATALATEVATKEGPLVIRICMKHDQQMELYHDTNDHTLFSYRISDDRAQAAQEKKCVAERIGREALNRLSLSLNRSRVLYCAR